MSSDDELIAELGQKLAQLPELRKMTGAEADQFSDRVATRYVRDRDRVWWWSALACPSARVPYDGNDGLGKLISLVGADVNGILFLTDDHGPAWPAVIGQVRPLCELLSDLPMVEFFIVAPDCSWIVFDTHENALIVAGRLLGWG